MKKTVFYTFLTLCFAMCAIGFTSCSDDDDNANFYTFGLEKSIVLNGDMSAAFADMAIVENALKAEFGDYNFVLNGDTEKLDEQVETRFEKATQGITLKGGWIGTFYYSVTRQNPDGDSKVVVTKQFRSPDNVYE